MHYISQRCHCAKARRHCCLGCWLSLGELPETSLHRCFGFTDSMQLPNSLLPEEVELKAPYWDHKAWWTSTPAEPASPWNKSEPLHGRRARNLHTALQEPVSPRVHAAGDKGGKMRGRRGNRNRQWVERGSSSVRAVSRGRRQLWHISRMKVNGTEDLQDEGCKWCRNKSAEGKQRREGGGGR